MYPEDRVLVGVINRKLDLEKAQLEHWYRIPQGRVSGGIYTEYVAFFLSRNFNELNGGIHYYARRTGIELAHRRDLLPDEANHSRADNVYHKLQLGELRRKDPPILNPTKRPIAFIYTTWDRFEQARVIADLYSEADWFVARVYRSLAQSGVPSERTERIWEASRISEDGGAQLRIECVDGIVIASTSAREEHVIPLTAGPLPDAVYVARDAILAEVEAKGGWIMINTSIEE
ncbi:MAG: hypothetical protein JXQ72_16315 [Anaerolineae bacterium]|nr:hypothetical protein [Anaerolineae bacterium]